MSILNDFRPNHRAEAELANAWEPEGDGDWEPENDDDPIEWLPSDSWFDRQAEIFEAKGTDLADHVAKWLRAEAKAMRALDAGTLEEYLVRSETYGN